MSNCCGGGSILSGQRSKIKTRAGHVTVMRGRLFWALEGKRLAGGAGRVAAWTCSPLSPELETGSRGWLPVPGRPCVFWVITGFGVPSTGRGHAVQTNMLEPASRLWPDTPPPSSSSSSSLCSHLHRLQHVPTTPLLRRNSLLFLPPFISSSPPHLLVFFILLKTGPSLDLSLENKCLTNT